MSFARACSIAIFSCVLLLQQQLPWCHAGLYHQQTDSLAPEGVKLTHSDLLIGFLDAERSAVERQLELYKRKATLLKALLTYCEKDDELHGDEIAKDSAATALTSSQPVQSRRAAQFQQSRQRAYRQQHQHSATQRFSDWFDPQGSYYSPLSSSPCHEETTDGPRKPSEHHDIRLDLLSFRPNASPNGKKSHNAQRGGRRAANSHLPAQADPTSSSLLQFLAAFDMERGRLNLHHPITKELIWQHELIIESRSESPPSSSPITDYFFTSERLSYLATLQANGKLSLYKLRVLHNRRLLSGDHRIPSKFDRAMCMRNSITQQLQKKNQKRTAVGMPLILPWRTVVTTNTLPAVNHPHIDFELIFSTSSNPDANSSVRNEKVAVVTFFSHSYVVTANSEAELAFFHGENGTFISSLATDWFTQDNDSGVASRSITQLHVLTTGIVAAAVGNRIHFVNPLEQTLVNGGGVICDGGANEKITSVDSDPWRYSTIYAGTSSGRVLVFRLLNVERLGKGGSSRRQQPLSVMKLDEHGNLVHDEESEPACVLVNQLRPKPRLRTLSQEAQVAQTQVKHQTAVRAIPGYVIMTTNDEIVLFQSSYDGLPTYVTAYSTHSNVPQLSRNSISNARTQQLIGLSVARDPNAHLVALAIHALERFFVNETTPLVATRLRMDVYESLLPQPTSSLDLGWLRVPIMLLCAIAVMYWQQSNNNNGNGNIPNPMDLGAFGAAGGSQRGKISSADFDVSRFSKMGAAGRTYPQHHCV